MHVSVSLQTVHCTCALDYKTRNLTHLMSEITNQGHELMHDDSEQQASCSILTHLIGAVMWSRLQRLLMWSTSRFLEESCKLMRSAERRQREIRTHADVPKDTYMNR